MVSRDHASYLNCHTHSSWFKVHSLVSSRCVELLLTSLFAFQASRRKDLLSGPAIIGTREVYAQFLRISIMNFIKSPKTGPAKTGQAGPASMPTLVAASHKLWCSSITKALMLLPFLSFPFLLCRCHGHQCGCFRNRTRTAT